VSMVWGAIGNVLYLPVAVGTKSASEKLNKR
jgi:hypothetical protein